MTLHPKHNEWLEGRGIDPELASRFGLSTTSDGGGNWLTVPYLRNGEITNRKYRLTSRKDHRMDAGAALSLWNRDILDEPGIEKKTVVITEGEWDALAAIQSGHSWTMSVPNGAPKTQGGSAQDIEESTRYQFLARDKDALDRLERIVVATDSDEPGRVLAADLVTWLGADRCYFVTYPDGCKDLNDVLVQHGEAMVSQVIANAKPYPVQGLYTIDDFPEPPPMQTLRYGIAPLSDMLPVVPGTFTALIGYAGAGKTTLTFRIVADLLMDGNSVAIASFETLVKPVLVRGLEAAMAGTGTYTRRDQRHQQANEILRERLHIIGQTSQSDESDMDLDRLLDLAAVAVMRHRIKLLLIDPWNEIDHKRGRDETETDYSARAIRALRRFAKNYGVAVWVVAHPAKPVIHGGKLPRPSLYHASGSAHWANKPDYGLIVHRPKLDCDQVDLHVVKVRTGFPGQTGKTTQTWIPAISGYGEYQNDFEEEAA